MMTATSLRLTAVLVVVAAALPRPARAQSAEAEELFQEGKRLTAKGDLAQACEKFEASDRIEPASGTELNLARCRENNGQIASAWAAYLKTAATAKHDGNARREAEARKRAAALQARLIYLTITVPDDVRVEDLVIKRNGTPVDDAVWGQRVPVDPDDYTVSSEAPGHKPWSTTVVVKTKSKMVVVPALDKLPEPKRAEPRHEAVSAADDAAPSTARERDEDTGARPAPSRWTGRRKLSLVLVAVGVAAGGAGVGLGLHANSLEDQSDATCNTTKCTDPKGVALNTSARHYALAANAGFAVGGAAVIGAAVLWFLGAPPSGDGVAIVPALDHGRVGLSLARSF